MSTQTPTPPSPPTPDQEAYGRRLAGFMGANPTTSDLANIRSELNSNPALGLVVLFDGRTPLIQAVATGNNALVNQYMTHVIIHSDPNRRDALQQQFNQLLEAERAAQRSTPGYIRPLPGEPEFRPETEAYVYTSAQRRFLDSFVSKPETLPEAAARHFRLRDSSDAPALFYATLERAGQATTPAYRLLQSTASTDDMQSVNTLHFMLAQNGTRQVPGEPEGTTEFVPPFYLVAESGDAALVPLLRAQMERAGHPTPDLMADSSLQGVTPVQIAARHGHVDAVNALLKHIPLRPDQEGKSYLDGASYFACAGGHLDMLVCLEENGVDINASDLPRARTPFMVAVHQGHRDVVEYYIQRARATEGGAPMPGGATASLINGGLPETCDPEMARLLLREGEGLIEPAALSRFLFGSPPVHPRYQAGENPAQDVAAAYDIYRAARDPGGRPLFDYHRRDLNGLLPIHTALTGSMPARVIDDLIAHTSAEELARPVEGGHTTALVMAVLNKATTPSQIQALIRKCPELCNREGHIPLASAVQCGNFEAVKILLPHTLPHHRSHLLFGEIRGLQDFSRDAGDPRLEDTLRMMSLLRTPDMLTARNDDGKTPLELVQEKIAALQEKLQGPGLSAAEARELVAFSRARDILIAPPEREQIQAQHMPVDSAGLGLFTVPGIPALANAPKPRTPGGTLAV